VEGGRKKEEVVSFLERENERESVITVDHNESL